MSPRPRHKARSKLHSRRPAPPLRPAAITAEPAPQSPRVMAPAARSAVFKAPLKLDYVRGDLKRIALTASAIVVGIVIIAVMLSRVAL